MTKEKEQEKQDRLSRAEKRILICEDCPNYKAKTRQCQICHCFMPLKVLFKRFKCPDTPPRWE